MGDYSVVELLSGSGTAVYRVKHVLTEREEAIKVVYGAGQGSIAESQQFLEEIRLQARLRHPHITEVMTAFWSDDDLVMVTELPEGKSLRAVMAEGNLTAAEAVEIIRQVLGALQHAHSQRIVHRGVSPDSILYSPLRRFAKLADFGLARARADQRSPSKTAIRGVPREHLQYAAPELLRGDSGVDSRADIYSCGATLYELLTGRAPYENTPETMLLLAIERDNLVAPSKLNPMVPASLDAVVRKAMKQWPDERFSSAEEFQRALEPIAKGLASPRKAALPAPKLPALDRAHELPKPVLIGVALAALAAIAILVQANYSDVAAAKPEPAVVAAPPSTAGAHFPEAGAPVPILPRRAIPAVLAPVPISMPAAAPAKLATAERTKAAPQPASARQAATLPTVVPLPVKAPVSAALAAPAVAPPVSSPAIAPLEPPPAEPLATRETAAPEPAGKPNVVSRVGSGIKRLNPFRRSKKPADAQASPENSVTALQ